MTEDSYIKWIQVIPGALKIDHHIIVLAHQPEFLIAPLIGDRRGNNNNNTNNGGGAAGNAAGAGVSSVAVGGEKVARLAEYTRGNDGDIYPTREACCCRPAPSGFEFHYHPNGKSAAVDALKWASSFVRTAVAEASDLHARHLVSDQLVIPPGESRAANSYFTLLEPARLVSFQPHGHYRLRHMKLEAILPNGEVQA